MSFFHIRYLSGKTVTRCLAAMTRNMSRKHCLVVWEHRPEWCTSLGSTATWLHSQWEDVHDMQSLAEMYIVIKKQRTSWILVISRHLATMTLVWIFCSALIWLVFPTSRMTEGSCHWYDQHAKTFKWFELMLQNGLECFIYYIWSCGYWLYKFY